MSDIPKQLSELSHRIEDVEERIARVRSHIARLISERLDTTQARELVNAIQGNLQQLYRQRCNLRRQMWWIDRNWLALSVLVYRVPSASLPMSDADLPSLPLRTGSLQIESLCPKADVAAEA